MFRRLLMALLALCLAVPALAAPTPCALSKHEMATHAMGEHHGKHHEQSAPARQGHDCIGCAVPAPVAPFAVTPFHARERQPWSDAATPPTTAVQPDTPPPRA